MLSHPHRPGGGLIHTENGRLPGAAMSGQHGGLSVPENSSDYHHQAIPPAPTNLTGVAAWATAAALLALWEVREAYAREEEAC